MVWEGFTVDGRDETCSCGSLPALIACGLELNRMGSKGVADGGVPVVARGGFTTGYGLNHPDVDFRLMMVEVGIDFRRKD